MTRYILAALLLLFVSPAQAEEERNPLDVPPAPAPTEPVPDWLKYQNHYAGEQTDIANPHRTGEEIVAWAQNVAADAMSFTPAEFNARLTEIKRTFTAQGWNEYATWVRDSRLVDMVRTQNYGVSTIVNGDASVVNSGSVAGSYHWLVDIPVIITFIQPDASGEPQPLHGGVFRLTMQIGRVPQRDTEDGLVIEGWKVVKLKK